MPMNPLRKALFKKTTFNFLVTKTGEYQSVTPFEKSWLRRYDMLCQNH